jgi:predicted nucleic acid-binding protein
MSDTVVDSSVVAKWILPEADSDQAQRLLSEKAKGDGLIVLDLVFPEVANAIWKRWRSLQNTTVPSTMRCLSLWPGNLISRA